MGMVVVASWDHAVDTVDLQGSTGSDPPVGRTEEMWRMVSQPRRKLWG
jgi:hypothetical protein